MKKNHFSLFTLLLLATAMLTACSDLLDTESEMVEFEENNTLNHPTDSVYSVMGIVNQMQKIADRTVLLGEVRGDLVTTTNEASSDLKRLAAFDFDAANKYLRVSDYYAVINNCNYFINHVDTTLERRGRKIFEREYAAVKAFRAWTYLQLVINYGEVPLVTEPLMTEQKAEEAAAGERKGIEEICNYFINDLTPYAYVKTPQYNGTVGGRESEYFFIPMRVLLGDLCLWAGRYREAATWYHDFLGDKDKPILPNVTNYVRWTNPTEFKRPMSNYDFDNDLYELLSCIPMESRVFDGEVSDLKNIFNSTSQNNYYYQLTPSQSMRTLSADQVYCMRYEYTNMIDTIYPPREGLTDDIYIGDLRFSTNFSMHSIRQDKYSDYNSIEQSINKVIETYVITYRRTMVWLKYAEALCLAGFPESAFCILKYGLCNENAELYINEKERADAAGLINFNETSFMRSTVTGIHSIGSGDSECNMFYGIPMPRTALETHQDTVNWEMPRVEELIINEMALEGAFEGNRFFDLMRVALRRNDPAYLAERISKRNGEIDEALYQKLLNKDNWFLPLK